MIGFPKAKINLGLRITGKRPDGYHDIETIFYPVKLYDALEFVVSDNPPKEDFLTVSGMPYMNPDDNLVIKTVKKLRIKHKFPVLKMHLHKGIPVGAGLGGGSSDAACILKSINKGFGLNISDAEMKSTTLEIGSDCPFFIDCQPSIATGRGEILSHINNILTGYYLILLNPGVGISTKEAYQNCKPHIPAVSLSALSAQPVADWKELIINDFEEFAMNKFPVIGTIKNELYNSGALFSLMSGSGSSVYGIFREKPGLPENLSKYVIFEGRL